MNWRKLFRRGLMAIFILASLLTAVVVCAAIQIFDGTGQYIMSDFENHDIAKQRAQQRAELDAQKQAGVYLTSFSRSVNANLTNDEISAVTNNIIKVSDVKIVPVPFETNGEAGLMYRVTLKASIDPEGIYDYIKRDDKQKVTIVQQNNSLQDAIAKNDALIEDLKEQYKRATSQAEKNRIIKQMKQVDRDFLANQKLKEGNKLYCAKNYKGAIKLYSEVLTFGEYMEAYNNRGNAYADLGQHKQAIQDYNKAIELNPNNALAYNNRGIAYADLGQHKQAIQDYDKAIALNPNDAVAYYNRGTAYSDLGQYERAIQDYNKAIEFNPNLAEAYYNRGTAYGKLGQHERAIQDFDKAIELNPNYADAYTNRGVTYDNFGKYDLAIQDYNKALKLNPNSSASYYNRGIAYGKLGQNERAIQDYDKAIELKPDYSTAYNNRGRIYANLGQHEKAIQDFTKAIELNPSYALAYSFRGCAYSDLGQYERAIQDFDKAIELNPNDVITYQIRTLTYGLLGFYYQEQGMEEKAKAAFSKAKQLGVKG